MSVPDATVRTMATPRVTHGDERWARRSPQIYALLGGPNGPQIRINDGYADKPVKLDLRNRTVRQLASAGELWCVLDECSRRQFKSVVQGASTRTHLRHEAKDDNDDALHRGGGETVWHHQAKNIVYEWLKASGHPVRTLEREYTRLPALSSGRERRPDVYVEFENGARVAFECQRQTMAVSSNDPVSDERDGRAMWQNRVADYKELREKHGIQVVWLVSAWATIGESIKQRSDVWRVKVFGSYAAQMLEQGETVYWIDPAFGQIGTLLEHRARPADFPEVPEGYSLHARTFRRRSQWSWLHSENIETCKIDPATGTVATLADKNVRRVQWIADLHAELVAARAKEFADQQARRQAELAEQRRLQAEAEARKREENRQLREARAADYARYLASLSNQPRPQPNPLLALWPLAAAGAGLLLLILIVISAVRPDASGDDDSTREWTGQQVVTIDVDQLPLPTRQRM